MALRITVDLFSGRPNPTFMVEGPEAQDLVRRLARPRGRAASDRRESPPLPPSTLGYRGLVVEYVPDPVARGRKRSPAPRGLAKPVRVAGGSVYTPGGVRPAADPFVDEYVLGPNGPGRLGSFDVEESRRALLEIERFRERILRYPWKKWPWPLKQKCKCAPLWEPNWWNDAGQVQYNNNCYNYGTNYRSDTYAQPGLANGAMYASIVCADVRAGAIADALIAAPRHGNKCPKEGHLAALVVGPNWDFHWYRKGRNGLWTHKPGGTQATAFDNSGSLISDPRTADRGNYTDFCTFMIVMHGHVKVK